MKKKYEYTPYVEGVYVVRDKDFTIAFGEFVSAQTGVISFGGATKRNPNDHENRERGERLAIGNAFKNLGRHIVKEEYEAIHKQFHSKPKKKALEYPNYGPYDEDGENLPYCDESCEGCYDMQTDYEVGFMDGYCNAMEDVEEAPPLYCEGHSPAEKKSYDSGYRDGYHQGQEDVKEDLE